ncbi:hypothetical protein, partial [Klebsiella pneumoniae]|uniref:hypothetical protein n=1 Tax=Klebsiella pneumoniae TaxID=573 RepID=UPI00197AE85A
IVCSTSNTSRMEDKVSNDPVVAIVGVTGADCAGDADNRDDGIVTHFVLHSRCVGCAADNKKAPDLHQAGLRLEMVRLTDYARTPPEAPESSVVLVVRLVAVIMVPTYAGQIG